MNCKNIIKVAKYFVIFQLFLNSHSHGQVNHLVPALSQNQSQTVQINLGQSRVLQLDEAIQRIAVANPQIADYILIGPKELYILGKRPGQTNMVSWSSHGQPKTIQVQVDLDVSPLKTLLRKLLPDEKDLSVDVVGDTLILQGTVEDAVSADIALRLTQSQMDSLTQSAASDNPKTNALDKAQSNNTGTATTLRLVNLVRVRDPQQVMLEVRVAEVSKSYLESLGIEFGSTGGLNPKSLMTGFVTDATLSLMFGKGSAQRVNPDGSPLFSNKTDSVNIEAVRKDGWVKILAEPTIVAMSGQEGRFLVGGKIFIPVNQALGSTTYEERSYGVGLRFVPTVLSSGRINLQVAPEISEPVKESVTAGTSASLPAFKSSYVSTTVQMGQGENLVIGGLLRDNLNEIVKAVPVLGELPIFGALFRHNQLITERTELVIVVKPSLVKAQKQSPKLPTDGFETPTRSQVFLGAQKDVDPTLSGQSNRP